jgi:hypothetical protein
VRELRHVRWLVGLLHRDENGRLAIPPHVLPQVEQAVQAGLDDPKTAPELLDQIVRFASAALQHRGEHELARTLVSMVLAHPLGRTRLERSGDQSWTQFVVKDPTRAPLHDGKKPEGSIPLGALYNKRRKRF